MKYSLTPEQIQLIIDTVPDVSRHPERDKLLLETLWETGGRVQEVITLRPDQINLSGVVTLRNLRHKDSHAIKMIKLSNYLYTELRDYCIRNLIKLWVFPGNRNKDKHVNRWYVWYILDKASRQAGIYVPGRDKSLKGANPQMFRSSRTQYLVDETGDIGLVMRHLGISRQYVPKESAD